MVVGKTYIKCKVLTKNVFQVTCADPEGGGGTGVAPPPPPLKNHKNIGFLSNISPDHLKNHKAIKPAFNGGPSSACHRNAF